ncbi:RidA family protein [Virgibacillus flavescens]|uniref:RidA family protein n=1 Tax=Virgibacillus flavescens TaxID=1611422 RepID=UPI003D339222
MNKNISFHYSANLAQTDYAYASRVPSGMDLLYLAGSCPLDKDGKILHPNNYRLQAETCVDNLKEALSVSGATLNDVAYTRVLVASQDRSDLVAAWETIRSMFGEHDVPSTLSGVTVLGYPDQLVEIEAVAAIEAVSK